MAEATAARAPAAGRRYFGALSLTEDRRRRLVQIWQQARVPQGVVIAVAGAFLAFMWGWTPGYVAALFALLAVIEARLWLRSTSNRPPVISLFIEITGITVSLAYVDVTPAALGLPWSYLTLAAFLLLPLYWAIPAVAYASLGYVANTRDWLPLDTPPLTELQTTIAGAVVGILFTAAFLGLVSAVIAILNAESRRSRRRVAVDQALAQCSAALLGGGREDPEHAALTALLAATEADSVFISRNVEDPDRGLCSSLELELLRSGAGPTTTGTPDLVPWSLSPDARTRLEAGWSCELEDTDVTGRLRERDDNTGVLSQLVLPVYVNGAWYGVIGFGNPRGRDWSRYDNTLLATAAEMFGSFLERTEARHRIEATIHDLEEQRRYQTALADCSAALLTSDHDLALDAALDALLEATSADFAYVDLNYTDPTKGLCARIVHDAERVPTPVGRNEWWAGPYSDLPTVYEDLRHGRPSFIVTAQLSGRERELYEDDGVKAELCLPIQVGGEWRGSLAFGNYFEERFWTPGQMNALRTAANMIGSFWERRDARRTLERLVTSLDTSLTYEKALANCSRALLTSDAESAVDVALRELLAATNVPKVFVDVNHHDAELGLCARVVHEAVKPGFEHIVRKELSLDENTGVNTSSRTPYDWVPDMRDSLAAGQPVVVDTARLTEDERRIYANDNCLTELNIPIFSSGDWVGSLGFTEYETRRKWHRDEIAMLHTAAEMIGAFWERQASHHRLEELVRAKDEFVATVSHELRTPLTAVVGLSDELQHRRADFDENEISEFVSLIAEQSHEVAGIVEDLLTAARTSVGTLVVTCQMVDVRGEVEAVLAGLQTGEGATIEVTGDSPAVWADPGRFRQIIRNLITNARRHGGEHVQIELTSRHDGSVIAVLDDGAGIPAALQEQVFQPYARAHEAGTQPASVGLGLSVARELARLMGGDVGHRRTAGWTRFELSLPVAPDTLRRPTAGAAAG
jgi:signal transduction histidine kinase